MRTRTRFAALLMALSLALCACSGGDGASQSGAGASLPEPPLALERQILGDTSTSNPHEVTLYRASGETMELTTVNREIQPDADGSLLRPALEELLGALPGGGPINGGQIELEGVEYGSGIATVRLSPDVLANRSDSDYLLLYASIANTLLSVPGVDAVNVLCGDRSDPICALPTGTFTAPVDNVPAAYAQVQSERERFLDEGVAALERNACLYFPAQGGQYLLGEVRKLSFSDDDYASTLVQALCDGPLVRGCCFSAVPANLELLESAPVISVTADGERVLELGLSPVLTNYLALAGLESWQLYGSLVLTLTSFLPELDAVRVSIGGKVVTDCVMGFHPLSFRDGRMRRGQFAACIGGSAQLYFRDANGGLERAECAVSQDSAISARSVLCAMIALGDGYLPGLQSSFPAGVAVEDILGVSCEGPVATVNLSGNFYAQCQSLDGRGERALIYAMVNALTELEPIGAVNFLVEGRQVDSLAGGIYLRSALMPDPGLVVDAAPAPLPTAAVE